MAKKAKQNTSVASGAKTGAPGRDVATYFFLVTKTAKGRAEKDAVILEEQKKVTKLVKKLEGACELYSVQGPYDYVSRVTGVSVADAVKIAQQIESGGNVTAIMVPAFHIFK
jgi:hypothetical protein